MVFSTGSSGFEACFCWGEGGHGIHCMHCALQLLPDGLHTARQKGLAKRKANPFPTSAISSCSTWHESRDLCPAAHLVHHALSFDTAFPFKDF